MEEKFSLIIKGLRENMGLSQEQLAKHMNVSGSTVGMWESGQRKPRFEQIGKIADFFNVSTDCILGHPNASCEKYSNIHSSIIKSNNSILTVKNGEERELSEQEAEVLRIFGEFNTKKKAEVLLYLYDMNEKSKKEQEDL